MSQTKAQRDVGKKNPLTLLGILTSTAAIMLGDYVHVILLRNGPTLRNTEHTS